MRCVAMTVRLFAIEQPNMRVLGSEILLESNGHSRGQGNYSVFLVFALANVDDHAFKVRTIGNLVSCFNEGKAMAFLFMPNKRLFFSHNSIVLKRIIQL